MTDNDTTLNNEHKPLQTRRAIKTLRAAL